MVICFNSSSCFLYTGSVALAVLDLIICLCNAVFSPFKLYILSTRHMWQGILTAGSIFFLSFFSPRAQSEGGCCVHVGNDTTCLPVQRLPPSRTIVTLSHNVCNTSHRILVWKVFGKWAYGVERPFFCSTYTARNSVQCKQIYVN